MENCSTIDLGYFWSRNFLYSLISDFGLIDFMHHPSSNKYIFLSLILLYKISTMIYTLITNAYNTRHPFPIIIYIPTIELNSYSYSYQNLLNVTNIRNQ